MKKSLLLLIPLLLLAGCAAGGLSNDAAKEKVEGFINGTLMAGAPTKATVTGVAKENGLFKITVDAGGQVIDSYATLDGKMFFPQAMNMDEAGDQAKDAPAAKAPEAAAPATKQDKAKVELFVMSHCPYGTQMEKGILPVLEALGDDVDFELKFCDYAMHGEVEVDEQLNQVCIQEQGRDKILSYLQCFLESGKGDGCFDKAGVDKGAMEACVAKTDAEFNIKADFADKGTWKSGRYASFNIHAEENKAYGVGGSPTLVINGAKVSSGRNPATLLKTICAGFNNPPEACNTELPSSNPSPGFGFGTAGDAAAANCGA